MEQSIDQAIKVREQIGIYITPKHLKFINDFSYTLSSDTTQTHKHDPNYFRWFDTGDLQNIEMLWVINQIALQTSSTKHWLPTKEYGYVLKALLYSNWDWAPNLTLRLSVHIRNSEPSPFWKLKRKTAFAQGLTLTFSQVFDEEHGPSENWHVCEAPKQDHKCLDCRHCWGDEDVAYIWRK